MTEPAKRIILTGAAACRADMHEWCDVEWCDCSCHPLEEAGE